MKLPFFWLALGFTLGILLRHLFALPVSCILLGYVLGLCLLGCSIGRRFFLTFAVLQFGLLGFLFASQDAKALPCKSLGFADAEKVTLRGRVVSQPEIKETGRKRQVSWVLLSDSFYRRGKGVQKIEERIQVFIFQPSFIPQFGDRLQVRGKLERPPEPLNPGEFDYARLLRDNQICGVMTGLGRTSVRALTNDRPPPELLRLLYQLRLKIGERIDALFHAKDAILFKALILGDRKGLDSVLRDEFMKTGTSHLLAISGLNISLVAGSFYFLMIGLKVPQKMAALSALFFAWAYVFIAGFGIPVQRAGWMAGVGFLAICLERERDSLNTFFLAYLILLVLDTRSLTNVSFQLSFISILALILLFRFLTVRQATLTSLLQTLAATAGTLPIVLYYFNVFSSVAVFANLFAIPLFNLALVHAFFALMFGSLPLVGFLVMKLAHFYLVAGLAWIHLWSLPRWGYWFLRSPSPVQIFLYYAMLGALCFWMARFPNRRKALIPLSSLWVLVFLSFFWPARRPLFSFTIFSAGQNELMHLRTGRHADWLINTGREFPSSQAQWILYPYLRREGINHLKGIFVTDDHKKHTGGIPVILRNFSSEWFFYPEMGRPPKVLARQKLQAVALARGDRVHSKSGVDIKVVGVVRDQLILSVESRSWVFLLLPDLDEAVLRELRNHQELSAGKAVVLILPASRRSERAFEELIELIHPRMVTLPKLDESVRSLLQARGIRYLELKQQGAATFFLPQDDEAKFGPLEVHSVKGYFGKLAPRQY